MQHAEAWVPTKFVFHKDKWRGSRDTSHVLSASRIMADRVAAAYAGAIGAYARGDMLDLGCGHVPLYGIYGAQVDSATCVDWPSTTHPSVHTDLQVDLGTELPLPSAAFDTVLLTDVLEHLPHPDRLWAELRRVLRPGGHVIVGVPFMYWLHEMPHDYHRYTETRLRLFCDDHGFQVVKCNPYGGAMDVLADVIAKILYISRILRWVVPMTVYALGPLGSVTRRLSRTKMPLGYVLIAQRQNDNQEVEGGPQHELP